MGFKNYTFITYLDTTYLVKDVHNNLGTLISVSGKRHENMVLKDNNIRIKKWKPRHGETIVEYDPNTRDANKILIIKEYDNHCLPRAKVIFPYGFFIEYYRKAYKASLEPKESLSTVNDDVPVQVVVIHYEKQEVSLHSLEVSHKDRVSEEVDTFLFEDLGLNQSEIAWTTSFGHIKINDKRG